MKTLLLFLFLLGAAVARGGWYDCYQYTGTIGSASIQLQLQIREGYFGGESKKHFNVVGVYQYDKYHQPIRVEGVLDTVTQQVQLYELQRDQYTAVLQFALTGGEGAWRDTVSKRVLPLYVQLQSRLRDINVEAAFEDVEVLQFQSLAAVYFVGVYSKVAGEADARMKALKIIGKKDGLVRQVLDVSQAGVPVGNVMTVIYDNLSVQQGISKNGFIIHNKAGRIGGYQVVDYDAAGKRFVLRPEVVVEGD